MKTIGLFGGSFNPIHNGHLALAKQLCDQEGLDELWFMVSPMNPFKQNQELLEDKKRLELVELAVQDDPRLVACDFEFNLPKPSYTYHTLNALLKVHTDKKFILIIGGDNWLSFSHWYKHKEILEMVDVWVYPRPGYDLTEAKLEKGMKVVHAPLFNFSSTDVRHAISNGMDTSGMLPENVRERIQQEKLYSR